MILDVLRSDMLRSDMLNSAAAVMSEAEVISESCGRVGSPRSESAEDKSAEAQLSLDSRPQLARLVARLLTPTAQDARSRPSMPPRVRRVVDSCTATCAIGTTPPLAFRRVAKMRVMAIALKRPRIPGDTGLSGSERLGVCAADGLSLVGSSTRI